MKLTLIELKALQIPTLTQGINTFETVALCGLNPLTQRWYKTRLKVLEEYLGTHALGDVNEADLVDLCATLEEREWSAYTLHGYLRAYRHFFKWLAKYGAIPEAPIRGLNFPRLPQTGRHGIRESDLQAMITAVTNDSEASAILHFFESTGCRLHGASSLTIEAIDFDLNRCTVTEKFEKSRTVFLNPQCKTALQAHIANRRSGRVFEMSDRTMYNVFKRAAELAGVTENWSPHQWRHRFGRRMASRGMNLGILSQIMGHSSVDVTVRFYGQFAAEQLQEAYQKYC